MKYDDFKNSLDFVKPDAHLQTRLKAKVEGAQNKTKKSKKPVILGLVSVMALAVVVTGLGVNDLIGTDKVITSDHSVSAPTQSDSATCKVAPGFVNIVYANDKKSYAMDVSEISVESPPYCQIGAWSIKGKSEAEINDMREQIHKDFELVKGFVGENEVYFSTLWTIERMENEKRVKVLDPTPKKEELPVVFADTREGNSKVIRHLSEMEIDVKVQAMAVGDYQVSDEVVIERKTAKDFVDSIVDKRLFKQARSLMEEFKRPLIILEGDDLYNGMINPNAIRGSIASIALDFGISIIPTRNAQDTAAMIKRIAIREQSGEKTPIQIRTDKKPVNLWEQQLFIIESLPNIGPVNAKNLLEHFGTVANIINASESQLQEVEGIGKKTAANIRKVVDSKYLYFQNEIKEKKLL